MGSRRTVKLCVLKTISLNHALAITALLFPLLVNINNTAAVYTVYRILKLFLIYGPRRSVLIIRVDLQSHVLTAQKLMQLYSIFLNVYPIVTV